MKIIQIIIIMTMVVSNVVYSQQKQGSRTTIDATELRKPGAIKGKNLAISDASLDKYVGTWVWSDGVNSLKIIFVKQTHQYGSNDNNLVMDILTGSYEFSKNGKLIMSVSDRDMSGSSGGKKDTVNLFMDIKSHNSQVALLVIYLPNHTLKLEIEKNRFEFRNDKNFELPEQVILTKQ